MENITNEQEASEAIAKLVQEVYNLLGQAEQIADKFDVYFGIDVSYGMGGEYNPNIGWCASSQSC